MKIQEEMLELISLIVAAGNAEDEVFFTHCNVFSINFFEKEVFVPNAILELRAVALKSKLIVSDLKIVVRECGVFNYRVSFTVRKNDVTSSVTFCDIWEEETYQDFLKTKC